VIDGTIVTSQGPGTCMEFALALVRIVSGATKSDEIARGMVAV